MTEQKIIQGEALQVLKTFPSDSIDLIVTDPPYGYNFMGKDWDKTVVPVEIWREALRVLKAGAFVFVMSAPRQDVLSQMIVRLGQAGFNTAFTSIYWTYASGFPKPINISKFMDKKFGVEMPVGKSFTVAGKYSEKVGDPTPQGEERDKMRHEPTTIQAKSFNGSYGGFQPKPAVEIIIVCMKPLSEKTFVDQALANGKGVTWLDDARIPFEENPTGVYGTSNKTCTPTFNASVDQHDFRSSPHQNGRFPANLLVSDDVLNDGKIRSSCKSSKEHEEYNPEQFKFGGGVSSPNNQYDDSGSFSRYFDLDKWFDKTIENLSEGVRKTFPFLICPKASKAERNKGLEDLPNRKVEALHGNIDGTLNKRTNNKPSIGKNFHPTVKPLKLMSYLVTLGSRENDTILDPFIGSGTTTLACRLLNRNCVGIELEPSYVEIARARLSSVHKNQKKLGDWF